MPKYKSAKRQAKRQKSTKALATIQKMEKGFMQAPAKLAAIINKEIVKLTRATDKQKKAVTKLSTRIKNNEARLKKTASAATPVAKKKAKLAHKAYQLDLSAFESLDTQLAANATTLETLTKQHAKLTALDKQLVQFAKEWAKNESSKAISTKVKPEAKQKQKSKKKVDSASKPAGTEGTETFASIDLADEIAMEEMNA